MIDEDKLKSKIEGLKSNLIHGACSSQIAMETCCKEEAYNEVLAILNSMQEEHKLKPKFQEGNKIVYVGERKELDTDEHTILYVYDDMYVTTWGKKIPFKFQDDYQLVEEHVSEELEQAAVEAFKEIVDDERNSFLEIFKAGATWQKEQDKQWLAEEHKHIFAKGRESMKQQMMKGAVDGLVYAQLTTSGEIMIRSNYFKSETLDYLDNVKLIIIKEDKV